MNKQQAVEIVKGYAPHYPNVSEFFVTSDGQVFFAKHTAEGHGRSLDNKEVQDVHVSDLLEISESGESDESGETTESGETSETGETDETSETDESGESGETDETGETSEAAADQEPAAVETAPNKATTYGKEPEEAPAKAPAKKGVKKG